MSASSRTGGATAHATYALGSDGRFRPLDARKRRQPGAGRLRVPRAVPDALLEFRRRVAVERDPVAMLPVAGRDAVLAEGDDDVGAPDRRRVGPRGVVLVAVSLYYLLLVFEVQTAVV